MKVSIVVPAYNEEENLIPLMEKLNVLKSMLGDAEVILVDDNSTDSTPEICDRFAKKYKHVRALHRSGERGMGNTLKEGTKAAKGKIIVWAMADLSDDFSIVPKFVEKIERGADMVFGSRYMEGGSSGDLSPLKRFASWGFSFLSRTFIGVKVHDITNAFRAFRKEIFDKIQLAYGDFGISPEFALKAHIAGYKLEEVPTTYAARKKGVAQFRIFKMGIKFFKIFLSAIWWRVRGIKV